MAEKAPVVRFAPSPTGLLHIGNIRTAVLNWLFARKHGGTFILRLDDTDRARSKEEFADAIRQDLRWLGLSWQREERQSARLARYHDVAENLRRRGLLYPCYETEEELDRRRKRQMTRGAPPVYDRAALDLTAVEQAKLESQGRRPYWRFKLAADSATASRGNDGVVRWQDGVRGQQAVALSALSDPVLVRADGTCLYTFTSVVDDVDFGITQVIRGEDHVTNTAVQIDIMEALGVRPPAFAHHSMLVGADGEALSKRLGSLSVRGLREAGLEPMAIVSHAALVGTSDPLAPHGSLDELAALFSLGKLSRAPVRFDVNELKTLNAKLLHAMPYAQASDQLAALGIDRGEDFWLAVRGNIGIMAEAADWWKVAYATTTPVVEDAALCAKAADLLPPEPWDEGTWSAWTSAVKGATGAKGRALFHPLRLALTGRETGPELRLLLPQIGRARARARLRGQPA